MTDQLPPSPTYEQVGSVADYLARGPGFVFLAHPALGPLWRVVGQKIRGGSLAPRSEVQLEVVEACLRDVHVAGSLRVLADAPMGHTEERAVPAGGAAGDGRRRMSSLLEALLAPGANSSLDGLNGVEPLGGGSGGGAAVVEAGDDGTWSTYSQPCTLAEAPAACTPRSAERRLVFSQRCGRLRLHNVRVANAGVDWGHADNVWWRHSLVRKEACTILLRGMSGEPGCFCEGARCREWEACLPGACLNGSQPHGMAMPICWRPLSCVPSGSWLLLPCPLSCCTQHPPPSPPSLQSLRRATSPCPGT